MCLPEKKNDQSPEGESGKQLTEIVHANSGCHEIKLQVEDSKVNRIITKQHIALSSDTNIEKMCRQFANQDLLIKIRNGKKISVERIRIIKP